MLKAYQKRIFEIANRGDAREESYYSCLERFISDYAKSINRTNVNITTLPKKTDAGNPDFRIWDGKQHIVGYIEAKATPPPFPPPQKGGEGGGGFFEQKKKKTQQK